MNPYNPVSHTLRQKGGEVIFVGAGPGDPDLLTLKAVRSLQTADVILFDDLVSEEVLEFARREAKKLLVGKRAGRASCRQSDICELLIRLASAGRRVVRLKSGDPSVFGRLGEEISAISNYGIPYSVVPGITTALAASAALGATLTHRDYAQSVRFITAHSRRGGLPDEIDWATAAREAATLMVYMGGRTARALGKKLLYEGMAAETPVVAISNVSRTDEHTIRTTISELARHGVTINDSPILICIGEVFAVVDAYANASRQENLLEAITEQSAT